MIKFTFYFFGNLLKNKYIFIPNMMQLTPKKNNEFSKPTKNNIE